MRGLNLRIIQIQSLRNPEEISKFLRREIDELLSSGETVSEMTIGVEVTGGGAPMVVERAVTLRMDRDGRRVVTVEGLVNKPVRIPIKKNSAGPSQFLTDEIDGAFDPVSF